MTKFLCLVFLMSFMDVNAGSSAEVPVVVHSGETRAEPEKEPLVKQQESLSQWLFKMDAGIESVEQLKNLSIWNLTVEIDSEDFSKPRKLSDEEIAGISFKPGIVLDKTVAQRLRAASNLKSLEIKYTEISDDFFDEIPLTNLEYLWAEFSNLSDTHCIRLAKLPNLKVVTAHESQVTREGEKAVRQGVAKADLTRVYFPFYQNDLRRAQKAKSQKESTKEGKQDSAEK